MSELKPCPFCSGDASLIVKTFFGFPEEDIYKVACNDCKSHSCYSDDSEETAKVWNTRPAEDAKDKEIERLKAEVTRYRRALHNLKEDCQRRLYWKQSSLERLFLHEIITHIDAELDYGTDNNVPTKESEGEDE